MALDGKEIAFHTSEANGVRLHVHGTSKFKTTAIVALVQQELSEAYATRHALLGMVLKRATARFPDTRQLREHLEKMYGAVFDVDVVKKGERHILQIYLEVPNEKFLGQDEPLLEQAFRFVGDVLARPYLEGGGFAPRYVKSEKEALRKRIESVIDDKMKYASQRLAEEMCRGEPYALTANGRAEDLPELDGTNLYAYSRDLLAENPIDLFVLGDVDESAVRRLAEKHIQLERRGVKTLPAANVQKPVEQEREVVEHLEVGQAKLNIGCRTYVTWQDDDYPALAVMNGVLGGFPHSKLFVNVREKASLAYYALSRLDSHKGILVMMSGIDAANYERAAAIMKEQVQLIRDGQVSDEELSQTRATLVNQYREILDNPRLMIDFAYNGVLSGRPRLLAELVDQVSRVTLADVQRVAERLRLDTVYLLRNKGGV